MLKLLIKLSALSMGLCYATSTSCQNLQQSQLASLNERMSQMISALYSPPFLSKSSSSDTNTSPSTDAPLASSHETPSYSYSTSYPSSTSTPQVIYVSPSSPATALAGSPSSNPPYYLEAGLQPVDYAHPEMSYPVPRAAYPSHYTYDYNYPSTSYPPVGYPPVTYPYPYPPVPKPCDYNYYHTPEYTPSPAYHSGSAYHPRPAYPPAPSPPPHQPPMPSYPPPYHPAPPSYSSHSPPPVTSYSPAPYPKHSDLLSPPQYS